ncbi:MAG: hypothetical protein WKF78_08620 [Candidatus Limnocylindrales bacterium]
MSKSTVTRLFIGGVIAVGAGAVLALAAVWLAFANDVFVMAGPDVVGVRGGSLAWSLLGLGIVGGLAIMGGLISGLVSWIGALLNTWQLESKTWFAVLLLLGHLQLRLLRDDGVPDRRARRHGSRRPDLGRGGRRSDGLRWLRHIRLASMT